MIGLDTNVWIRYIVQDDKQQSKIATDLIEKTCSLSNPAFINEVTLCEIVWVLKRAYRYDKTIILTVLKRLFNINEVRVASLQEALQAYNDYESGNADFSDYFIARINQKFDCKYTFSFDKKACQSQFFKLLTSKNIDVIN